jgi:hypothetical protein
MINSAGETYIDRLIASDDPLDAHEIADLSNYLDHIKQEAAAIEARFAREGLGATTEPEEEVEPMPNIDRSPQPRWKNRTE